MTYDLADLARARRLRALSALTGPRSRRPSRNFLGRLFQRLPLAA